MPRRMTAVRVSAALLLVVALACTPALAGKVLQGVPNYGPVGPQATQPDDVLASLEVATLSPDAAIPVFGGNPLDDVPEYVWWYGCSPTSGGMVIGYWDGRPGFGDLYDGDASVWSGDGNTGTRSMVASTAHITAGAENGMTYGDWQNSLSYPNHEDNPDCIADFMHTQNGGSFSYDIAAGLEAYAAWDNPATAANESYPAVADVIDVPFWGGTFDYPDLQTEVDAGRPVLLNMMTYANSAWRGHTVVAYGYQDDMFDINVPLPGGTSANLTVPGFAVMDTWANGIGQSNWLDWGGSTVNPVIDGNGVEWWPFIDLKGSSYTESWDWMISDAVTLNVLPEPATLSMLAIGGIGLALRRRRNRAA